MSGQSPGNSPGLKPPLAPREDGVMTTTTGPPPGLGPPATPPRAEADNWRADKARKASGSDLASLAEAIAEIPMEEPIVEKSTFTPGHCRTRSNVPLRVPPLLEPLGGPLAEERAKLPVHSFKQHILQVRVNRESKNRICCATFLSEITFPSRSITVFACRGGDEKSAALERL